MHPEQSLGEGTAVGGGTIGQEGGTPLSQDAILPSGGGITPSVGGILPPEGGMMSEEGGMAPSEGVFLPSEGVCHLRRLTFCLLRAALSLLWAVSCVKYGFQGVFGAMDGVIAGASEADGAARAQCTPPLGAPLLVSPLVATQNRTTSDIYGHLAGAGLSLAEAARWQAHRHQFRIEGAQVAENMHRALSSPSTTYNFLTSDYFKNK